MSQRLPDTILDFLMQKTKSRVYDTRLKLYPQLFLFVDYEFFFYVICDMEKLCFPLSFSLLKRLAPFARNLRSPGFTRPEIRSWIVDVHKVWYSVSNFYSKNSPLHQPCSHGAFVVTQPRTKSAIAVDSTMHL